MEGANARASASLRSMERTGSDIGKAAGAAGAGPTRRLRPRGALYAIDLLRFGAAMLVLLFHYFAGYASPGHRLAARFLDQGLLPDAGRLYAGYGWIGVEIFFVISGYVIAISAHGSKALPFARRRVLRLWPAALICATLSLALLWPSDPRLLHLDEYWRSALLWPWGKYVDDSYWTLAIECMFYALVALMLWVSPSRDRIEWLTALLGFVSLAYWTGGGNIAGLSLRGEQLLMLTHGCFFAIGILLHRWHAGHRGLWRALALSILIGTGIAEIMDINRLTAIGMQIAYSAWAASMIFFAGLAVVALSPRIQPWLERHLPRRPVLLLGLATYPLYLIHQTLGLILIGGLLRLGVAYVPSALIALAAITVTAIAIAAWVEPALRRLLDRALPFSVRRRDPAPDRRPNASPTGG